MSENGGDETTAALLIIGDEILSGRTRDANLPQLAEWLNARGVRLREVRVVPDLTETIVDAVNALRRAHDYLFTTGGIGPTHDDITADAIARAFDVPLTLHPEAFDLLAAHYPDGEFTPARQRMARVPEGGALIENPVSVAPGFRIGNVFVLAGVPQIMRAMLDSLAHEDAGGAPMLSRSLGIPMPESAFAEDLAQLQAAHPDVQIGSYPYYREGRAGLHVVMRSTDLERLERLTGRVADAARSHGVEPIDHPGEG